MSTSTVWTEDKLTILKNKFKDVSLRQLSYELGISYNNVRNKAKQLGLDTGRTFKVVKWTEAEDNIVKKHFEFAPKDYLTNLLTGRTWQSILNRGYKNFGLSRLSQDKVSLDYMFFDSWNPNSAYMIGFILADGYVHKGNDQNVLQIEVAPYDRDILDKFSNVIDFKGKLYERSSGVKFQTHNLRIINKLIEYGIPSIDKSHAAKYLNVPSDVERHFIRGLIDGDGWSRIDSDGNYNLGLCGTYDIVSSVKDNLLYNCDNNKVRQQGPNCYRFNIKGQKAVLIAEWLYDDADLFLDRKFEAYKEALRHLILRRRGNSARTRGETQ